MTTQNQTGKTVYSSNLFSVKHIEVVLPDGIRKTYELIDIQSAVTLLPVDGDNNVYFVEQFRIGANKTLLELPAGKIEHNEAPSLTAQRELREEIGMDAGKITPLGNFYMTPGYASEYMYSFLATGLFPSPLTPDADEFLKVRKIPLEKVMRMVDAGEFEDGKTLAVLMLARNHLKL
jgi:ADP-ribose pyrophosphatase